MTTTPNINIPYVPENTLDPAAGLNLALNFIDALLQTAVISMDLTAPPMTNSDGDLYIVAGTGGVATGAWAGHELDLARYVDEGNFWQFFKAGVEVHYVINREDGNLYKFVEGSPTGNWTLAAGLSDAPNDGTRYVRLNGAWEALGGNLSVQDSDSPPNVVEDVEVLQVAGGVRLTELAPGVALLETASVFAEVVNEPGDAVLATGDGFGRYTRFTNASPKTYTFDAGTQTYVSGNEYYGRNVGSGALTIIAAGMTINAPPGGSLVVPVDAEFRVKIISPTEADLMIFGTGTAGETPPQVMSITSSTFGADTTDHQVDMPATVDNGDLLIVGFSNDGNATVTTPSGWTLLGSDTGQGTVRGSWYYRIADGTEGGTQVNFETSAAENAAAQVHRIRAGTFDPATPPEIQIQSSSVATTAQIVPLIEPSWGYANSLFIASTCADDDDEINGWPYPFLQTFTESAATTTSCSIYSAYIQLAIVGMGPLAWSTTAAEDYVSAHIAVRPSV